MSFLISKTFFRGLEELALRGARPEEAQGLRQGLQYSQGEKLSQISAHDPNYVFLPHLPKIQNSRFHIF